MIGTIVNTLAAVVGGLLGSLLKKGIPERFADLVQKGLALCVLYIGVKGSLAVRIFDSIPSVALSFSN